MRAKRVIPQDTSIAEFLGKAIDPPSGGLIKMAINKLVVCF